MLRPGMRFGTALGGREAVFRPGTSLYCNLIHENRPSPWTKRQKHDLIHENPPFSWTKRHWATSAIATANNFPHDFKCFRGIC